MPTSMQAIWVAAMAVAILSCCSASAPGGEAREPADGETSKPSPPSRLQYRLQVDAESLPTGVVVRERRVPAAGVQTWIRNESGTPFVILSVDSRGTVTRRQKIVGDQVFLGISQGRPTPGEADPVQWQLLEGVDEVLLSLNYTPDAIVGGRSGEPSADIEVPEPEPFSIQATFGGEELFIRGQIVYSLTSAGSQ